MALKIDGKAFAQLGKILQPPEPPPPPPKKKKRAGKSEEGWAPSLTPKQQEAFDSSARYILAYGEKGSGKTIGLLHKMVRHAYENNNALCLIVVRVKSMATKGGAFDKLNHHILPRWRDGNRDAKTGELVDDGLQIEFSEVKYDAQHNEYIWVENRHGNWSMIVLISAQHSHQLRERIRGYEPSFVLVDELTSCDTIEYLRAIAAQIGRREGIDGPQQYTAACNPEGPSHWVYKAWFEDPFDPATGEWDPDYHKIHVPIEDNRKNLPDGYLENLAKLYKGDPIEAARMLSGVWIERPSGEALFLDVFIPNNHVKPSPGAMERIIPEPDYPIIMGMDPGATNNSYSFMQWYPVDGAMKWIVFDEIVYTQRRITYRILVPSILRRLAHWNTYVFGHGVKKRFRVAWNSDTSAFNQFRAAQGSFDAMEFEKIANAKVGGLPPLHETLGVAKMKITPAPKFQGSVIARVRLTMDLLSENRLLVSAGCPRHIEMLQKLESEKCKPGQPYDAELALTPRRSAHLHPFDSMSYPLLTGSIVPQLLNPAEESSGAQSMFSIGA